MREDKLIIRDIPAGLWVTGIVFLGITLFLITKSAFPTAAITGVVSLLALFLPAALTITADQTNRTLTLRYGLVIPRSTQEIPFHEINTIRVASYLSHNHKSSKRHQTTYRLELVKTDGTVIPFRSMYSSDFFLKQRRAEKLRTFIGLAAAIDETPIGILRAMPQLIQPVLQKQQEALTGDNQKIRETNSVKWQVQTISMGAAPVTRWLSADFKMPNGFLYLAQKMAGQQASGAGFLGPFGKTLFQTSISLYGFGALDTPNLERAGPLSPLDASLEPVFTAFTSDPASAWKILNPRLGLILRAWTDRYPLRQLQYGKFGQLVVLFSPNGVFLATLNTLQPDHLEELAALGVELVKAQGRVA
jgi:hypothetical protein